MIAICNLARAPKNCIIERMRRIISKLNKFNLSKNVLLCIGEVPEMEHTHDPLLF